MDDVIDKITDEQLVIKRRELSNKLKRDYIFKKNCSNCLGSGAVICKDYDKSHFNVIPCHCIKGRR